MKLPRIARMAGLALALLTGATAVTAEGWPTKPITLIVSFAAGGNADLQGRIEAKYLEEILGVPIKVENVPGGGHVPGVMKFLGQPADGYTMFRYSPPSAVIGPLVRNVPYNPSEDFAPLWVSNQSSGVLYVRADSPYETFDDFIEAAKAEQLIIGVNNIGAPPHLSAAWLGDAFDVEFKILALKTIPASITGLIGGQADAAIGQTKHLNMFEGELRALAILDERKAYATADLPGIPTLNELHPDLKPNDWVKSGWTAKAGTDPAITAKLVEAGRQVFENPEFQAEFAKLTTLAPVLGVEETSADLAFGIEHTRGILEKLGMLAAD